MPSDPYPGKYQIIPPIVVTITREDGLLFGQVSGFPKSQIYLRPDGEFFFKEVDVQVRFLRDEQDRVNGLVLRRNGFDLPAARKIE